MPAITVATPEQAREYTRRLHAARDGFDRLGYGARQRASMDLRIPPSRVSGVLNHRENNNAILTRLENWLANQRG